MSPQINSNDGSQKAALLPFPVKVNGLPIVNSEEPNPVLFYRDITYFPMTWRFTQDVFGWNTSWDAGRGFGIESCGGTSNTQAKQSDDLSGRHKMSEDGSVNIPLYTSDQWISTIHYRQGEIYMVRGSFGIHGSADIDKLKIDGIGLTRLGHALATALYFADKSPNSSDNMVPGNEQFDFLIRDLQSTSAIWKIVYFHYPPYVSAGYQVEDLRELSPLLEQYGVDLVFNTHSIVYERSHPIRNRKVDFENGIVYIVAGGAGAIPEWFLPKRDWHTAQSLAVPHFLHVVMTTNSLELQAIDEHGRLFDKFSLYKDSSGKRIHV